MKIALIGYGKMGVTLEEIAREKGHEVVLRARSNWKGEGLEQADVAIEFTQPEAAVPNLLRCFDAGVPVVCGTTGWLDHLEAVEDACHQANGALLRASNFSLGVNLYFHFIAEMGKQFARYSEYLPAVEEIHHIHKKDAPSGTALEMVRILREQDHRLQGWTLSPTQKENHIPVTAIREEEVPGTHTLTYSSAIDQLSITHQAYGRKGFAAGAVMAAEWLVGKKGSYQFKDLLNL